MPGPIIVLGLQNGDFLFLASLSFLIARIPLERGTFPYDLFVILKEMLGGSCLHFIIMTLP